MSEWDLKICCMGAGYTGGISMAVMAKQCPKIRITVVDQSEDKIKAWNSENGDDLPIYEPELLEIVQSCRGKNLFFSTDEAAAIDDADMIFIAVNAPTKSNNVISCKSSNNNNNNNKAQATDIIYCEQCARIIAQASNTSKIVVEKGTFPVRTAEAISRVLNSSNEKGLTFPVLSNPEFFGQGTAVQDLLNPSRVLIGGYTAASYNNNGADVDDTSTATSQQNQEATEQLVKVYANWVDREKILITNVWSAELAKLVANAFLAQRISSINSISALCEATGADVTEIAKAVGMDQRIGSKFMQASVGFGKSRFRKDIESLIYLCEQYRLFQCAEYWRQVVRINDFQKKRFSEKIVARMFQNVHGKKIAMLGYAFKKDTSDVRETPSMFVLHDLIQEQAHVHVYDPKVKRSDMLRELNFTCGVNPTNTPKLESNVVTCTDPYEACKDAHALLILTDWDVFKEYDYEKVYQSMTKPAFLFDGRNLLDHSALRKIGFEVHAVGKPNPEEFSDL